jgi:SAM-dependent methyltransferase
MATVDTGAFREFERRRHGRAPGARADFLAPVTTTTIEALLDAAAVGRGTRVLDVTCGSGVVAAAAAARGATVRTVDLSPRSAAPARALPLREAEPEALPFDEASLDAIVCNFGVGHFGRPEPVAVELVRVLAPGGRAALSWWDGPARTRVSGVFYDALAEAGVVTPAGPSPFRFSDDSELRALLTIAGLEEVTVRTVAWTYPIPTAEAWWSGGLTSLVRVSARVLAEPLDVQRRIRAVFDRLVERHRVDGGYLAPVAAKIAVGRKP